MTVFVEPDTETMAAPTVRERPPRVRTLDSAYEIDLLFLLARLDVLRTGIQHEKSRQRWRETLSLGLQVARRIGEVAERHLPTNLETPEFRLAVNSRREFDRSLAGIVGRFPTRTRLQRWGWTRERLMLNAAQLQEVQGCFHKLGEFVKAAFTLFINRYPAANASRGWVEAAAVFIVDFNRMVREWND